MAAEHMKGTSTLVLGKMPSLSPPSPRCIVMKCSPARVFTLLKSVVPADPPCLMNHAICKWAGV